MKFNCNHFGLLLLVFIFVSSCKNDPKANTNSTKNTETPKEQLKEQPKEPNPDHYVIIRGKSDDASALEYLNLLDFSNFGFSSYQKPKEKKVFEDSLRLKLLDIRQPQLIDLMAFSDTREMPYYSRIVVTPGDSIFMNVKDGKIHFSGENEAHYNFFLEMNDPLRQKWAVYKNDPYQYQSELEKAYQQKDDFLKNYIAKNPEVSDDFKNLVAGELKFEYLHNLMLPRNVKDKLVEGNYTNSSHSILYEYTLNQSSVENLFNYKEYFGNITIDDFKKPKLINNDYFKRSLPLYIRHYFVNHEYLDYSRKNFLDEKKFIQKNLDGEIEAYAIGRLINDYYMRGFGTGKQDIDIIKNLINEYAVPFSEPSYAKRMDKIRANLDMYDFDIHSKVLKEKLLTLNGDTITVAQILAKRGTSIKALNFWVSWCTPCVMDIQESKDFRETISKEQDVQFIYFSLDEDQKEWRELAKDLKNYIDKEQHYLILNGKTSKIVNYMVNKEKKPIQWYQVPRYSILSADNKVISNNCPRASDSINFKKVIDLIK